MPTISNLIWDELNEINSQKEKWDAFFLSDKLVQLSVLYANLTKHIAEMEDKYLSILRLSLDLKDGNKYFSVAKAQIYAQASKEYSQLRKAQNLEKALIETTRSIKKYIRVRENEEEVSRNL